MNGLRLVFMVLLLLIGPPLLAAEQVERTRGGVTVKAQLDRDAISLADEIVLTLSIEGPDPLEVDPIKAITSARTWIVSPPPTPTTTTLPGKRTRWQQTYRLSPLAAGDVALALQPVRVRAGSEEAATITLKPFMVKVESIVPGPALILLKPITGIEELPEEAAGGWERLARLAMTATVAALLLVFLIRRRRRVEAADEPPPDQWALRELDRLEGLARDSERYHTLLADVVRRYVDRRFGLHTQEQTTEEFLGTVQQGSQLAPAQQDRLKAFFARCDLAKYARASFAVEQCREVTALAREFIVETAKAEVPAGEKLQPA